MLERTYTASRFDEALAQVKRELGPDAIIVSSREIPGAGRLPLVEIKAVSKSAATQLGLMEPERSPAVPLLERRLRRSGVPASAATSLAGAVRRSLGGEPRTLAAALEPLGEALAQHVECLNPAGFGSRAVALVGPTGVGKTTTIAKMAAIASLMDGRRVGLVSIDNYRIAGTEQLAEYAELIGLPMEIAHDARSLEISLRRLEEADLVFVDTAGRSPRDPASIGAMADTLHGVHEPVEIHLCVQAGMGTAELSAAIDRTAVLRPTRLITTKLDEAVHYGGIVGAQIQSGLPLSFFTTGQRVPEDIEGARPERLAGLLCGEELD